MVLFVSVCVCLSVCVCVCVRERERERERELVKHCPVISWKHPYLKDIKVKGKTRVLVYLPVRFAEGGMHKA